MKYNHSAAFLPASISRCLPFFLGLLALLFCCTVVAGTPAPQPSGEDGLMTHAQKRFEKERLLFQQALQALKQGNTRKLGKLEKRLKHYPLLPFLKYKQLSQSLKKQKPKAIQRYLRKHPNGLYTQPLLTAWLIELGKKEDWKHFLNFYRPSRNQKVKCYYAQALLSREGNNSAAEKIQQQWLSAKSLPKACGPLISQWQASSSFNKDFYWQRAHQALLKKQFVLAKKMAAKAGNTYKAQAKRWISLYKHPKQLKNRKSYRIDSEFDQALVLMGLKRYLKQDMESFESVWNQYEQALQYPTQQKQDLLHYIARWYSWHYDARAWFWLAKADPNLNDNELMQRRVRMAIYNQNWKNTRHWITVMPAKQRNEDSWQYWQARAQLSLLKQSLGNSSLMNSDQQFNALQQDLALVRRQAVSPKAQQQLQQITAILEKLSTQRSYYGFLASTILNRPLSLNESTLDYSQDQLLSFQQSQLFSEVVEWHFQDNDAQAKKAWRHLVKQLSRSERSLASQLAFKWGWYHQAIVAAAGSSHRDNLKVRFPLAYSDALLKNTKNTLIDAEWAFSLIRQESAFLPNARSSAGAKGLMQLMPATAKEVAKKAGVKLRSGSLFTPQTNIHLGTYYLQGLAQQFDNNSLLATAAYNAGPRRSRQWRPVTQPIAGDIWAETIPIKETREYVKNIATYQPIYRQHLGLEVRLPRSLNSVPVKNVALSKGQ